MSIFYWSNLFLSLIITGGIVMGMPQAEKTQEAPITTSSAYGLSASDITILSVEAMKGNGESALKLSRHYRYSVNNEQEAYDWDVIGAENGTVISQHNIAYILLYKNKDDLRGIFWLRIVSSNGDESAKNRLLNELKMPVDLKIFDDLEFPNIYKSLSIADIEKYQDSALRGNGKAALVLANSYREISQDMANAEYWYRIGAQNGNTECKYNLGQILSTKAEPLNQARGKYWLDHAMLNVKGYE
jgi:TPR repeat protein